MAWFQRSWVLKAFLAVTLAASLLGGLALLTSTSGGLAFLPALALMLGTLGLGAWVGMASRARWVDQPRLIRAERRWAEGAAASEVLRILGSPPLHSGELGYRILQLRSLLHLSLEWRDQAWLDALEAQLARLPFWQRVLASRALRQVPAVPDPARLARGERLLRRVPDMGRLWHHQGILLLRSTDPEAVARAWGHFETALPLAWDDPLLLEDLLLAGLQHGRVDVAERALAILMGRHGDPRLPWDRCAAAMHLLRHGSYAQALALVQGLPPERRTHPLHWLAETVSRRQLGDARAPGR
jgi:hypothetical protein